MPPLKSARKCVVSSELCRCSGLPGAGLEAGEVEAALVGSDHQGRAARHLLSTLHPVLGEEAAAGRCVSPGPAQKRPRGARLQNFHFGRRCSRWNGRSHRRNSEMVCPLVVQPELCFDEICAESRRGYCKESQWQNSYSERSEMGK